MPAALALTVPDEREPLDQVLRRYKAALVAAGCSKSTITQRLKVLAMLQGVTDGLDPRDAIADDIVLLLGRPNTQTGEPLAPTSRRTYFLALKAFYKWCEDTDRLDRSPMRRMPRPRVPAAVPHPISEADLARALDAAQGDMYAWLILGAYMGLRVHEIAKIKGEDFTGDQLVVKGKGGVEARLRVHARVEELRRVYPRAGWWFPTRWAEAGLPHVTADGVSAGVSRFFMLHGIRETAHSLRHRFVTQVLKTSGGNLRIAQEAARHSSVATTQIYTFVDPDDLGNAITALP